MRYDETEVVVRFQEVDEWGIAWHGHYVGWFEVGRMQLLRKFELLPRQFTEMGFIAPVVNLQCDFKEPAKSGDYIIIRSTVLKPEKAALTFCFEIIRKKDKKILAKGQTIQVLMTTEGKLLYIIPEEIRDKIQKMIHFCNES